MKIMVFPPISYKKKQERVSENYCSVPLDVLGRGPNSSTTTTSVLFFLQSVFFRVFPGWQKASKTWALGLLRRDIKNEMNATRVVVML